MAKGGGINRSVSIPQPSIFGRVGTGFGQGLAEQIPKEIERYRLQSGLEQLANETQGMTPFQRFAKLSGIPGITPQAIQSGAELLRQEAIRNSFRNQPGQGGGPSASPQQTGIPNQPTEQPGLPNQPGNISKTVIQGGDNIPGNFATRAAEAAANQGLVKENPAQQKFIPVIPWTPQQRDENLGRLAEKHPELSFDQLQQLNLNDEERYLAAPEAYRKQQDYLKQLENEADEEFDKQLETTLQKQGKDIYGDLTGQNLLDVKKAMRHDLATDPKLTPKTAAEKWVKKGKDFVDTKNLVKEMSNRDLWDRIAPNKKEGHLKALMQAQKSYHEMGRDREFYNILRSNNIPPTTDQNGNVINPGSYGFGLSPGAAALIAYPRSDSIKKTIKSYKVAEFSNPFKSDALNRKVADDFIKNKTNSDSILAFNRQMQFEYPAFNSHLFIDTMREHRNEFTPDQQKELDIPYEDFFPNWGDLALFPWNMRSAAHD